MASSTNGLQQGRRRLLALLAFAWLNLLVQPCLAEPPAMPAGMEHCDHGDSTHQAASCLEMQAADCEHAGDFLGGSPHGDGATRTGSLLLVLPAAEADSTLAASPVDPGGGSTPLHIRYCNLRN